MSKLIEFYLGSGVPYSWSSIVNDWSDANWEYKHDFIQWLFPLQSEGVFNKDAPVLSDKDIREFHTDPTLTSNLAVAFRRFLDFMGLEIRGGFIQERANFRVYKHRWTPGNHNLLRITRVIKSMRLLGKPNYANMLRECVVGLSEFYGLEESAKRWRET